VRHRFATPLSLLIAVAAFAGVYLLTSSLLLAPILAAVAAFGAYLMLDDRTANQVSDDDYEQDAERKMGEALAVIRDIRKRLKEVSSPSAKHSLQQACDTVPELLERVKATSPNGLYSSASQLAAHLSSLSGVLSQYLDIQRKPAFYHNPAELLAGGEQAFARFAEFSIDSVRLVNSGELAQYQANLETVAPPKLPQLGKE
jgi:5-bromo-4-chloroindolyl phosphate hydrolysis protein